MNKQKKEQEMVAFEIESCRKNIEFYKQEIENMEAKLEELRNLKKAWQYY